jgi:hypothetical protein
VEASEAASLISARDANDHAGRIARLLELSELLPDQDALGFSGPAAALLFEDLKATWIYGYFTSTVVTSNAFCHLQLSGTLRLLAEVPPALTGVQSLADIAGVAVDAGAIDVSIQALLVTLVDAATRYSAVDHDQYDPGFERHLLDVEAVSDEDPLLLDARQALLAATKLVYRR